MTPFTRRGLIVTLGLAALLGCRQAADAPPVHARFGVFFGGQIQERSEIPLVFDRARQNIGVRLEFSTQPASEARVTWELEKPRAGKGKNLGNVVEYGEARTRPGEPVLDVPLAFRDGDRAGSWRIRVALDGKNVLDRAFNVVPATDSPTDD